MNQIDLQLLRLNLEQSAHLHRILWGQAEFASVVDSIAFRREYLVRFADGLGEDFLKFKQSISGYSSETNK